MDDVYQTLCFSVQKLHFVYPSRKSQMIYLENVVVFSLNIQRNICSLYCLVMWFKYLSSFKWTLIFRKWIITGVVLVYSFALWCVLYWFFLGLEWSQTVFFFLFSFIYQCNEIEGWKNLPHSFGLLRSSPKNIERLVERPRSNGRCFEMKMLFSFNFGQRKTFRDIIFVVNLTVVQRAFTWMYVVESL